MHLLNNKLNAFLQFNGILDTYFLSLYLFKKLSREVGTKAFFVVLINYPIASRSIQDNWNKFAILLFGR